jgi:uncharacterized protein (TIGR02300 family)
MATAIQDSKALRGTKRVCAACEVRFYDLMRSPIVCPSCGAEHEPAARPPIELDERGVPTAKTGWRRKPFKRPDPLPADREGTEAAEDTPEDSAEEGTPAPALEEDDVVLEQEPDEGDISGIVGHDAPGPKDN